MLRPFFDVVLLPSPISKLPHEIVREIFKFVVLSSEKARSHGVKSLCLVDRRWNDIANAMSILWAEITLTYPLDGDRLPAAQKWLKTSGSKVIDLKVDFCYPTLSESGKDNWVLPADFLRGMIAELCGSEHRWRSISVLFDIWGPTEKLLGAWVTLSFPALESISFAWLPVSFPH